MGKDNKNKVEHPGASEQYPASQRFRSCTHVAGQCTHDGDRHTMRAPHGPPGNAVAGVPRSDSVNT